MIEGSEASAPADSDVGAGEVAEAEAGALARDTRRAIINILEEEAGERAGLEASQRAIINILEDDAGDRAGLEASQRAIINILEDDAGERSGLEASQRAVINILEDAADERAGLEATQRAVVNVLDDVDAQSRVLEEVNRELAAEIEVRTRAEESLAATNQELEAFSYSVSHDLRAPLRAIDGFSQALVEDYAGKLEGEAVGYLARIRAGTQRMALLIDELLKLARISRGDMNYESVDLSAMANTILAELREADPKRQVECLVLDGIVARGDSASLRTALENLLNNAWKFTSQKEHARIEFGVTQQDGQPVYFVRDNGAGFDMAYAGKLFGVFQRLHADRDFPGVGVGLAIVQRVILRHGGRVWAEGALGKGATFSFTLGRDKEN